MKPFRVSISIVVLFFSSLNSLFAVGSGGYENQVPGARAMARANSVVASIDDASAVTFNPARLTAINGGDASLGFTYEKVTTKFETDNALVPSVETLSDPTYVPNFHIAHDFGLDQWKFGLGINVPYGYENEWPTTAGSGGAGIYTYATKSQLSVLDINPAVAYKINDKVSLGVGLDFYKASQKFEGFPFTKRTDETDGTGVGGNVGISYGLNEKHLFGLSYRTGSNIQMDGTLKIVGSPDENIKTETKIPPTLQMGYAFRANEKLIFELDGQWVKWSVVDVEHIDDRDTGQTDVVPPVEKNWRNRWSLGFGTEYALKPDLFLRAGYSYWKTPIPDQTLEPRKPDADTHTFSFGIGKEIKDITLDLAAQLLRMNSRHIENSSYYNGTYKTHAEHIAFNIGYKFGKKK